MRKSAALAACWKELEPNLVTLAPAVDCYGKYCHPWEPWAVGWDTWGFLEWKYLSTETWKYRSGYNELVLHLRKVGDTLPAVTKNTDLMAHTKLLWKTGIAIAKKEEKAGPDRK